MSICKNLALIFFAETRAALAALIICFTF